MKLLIISLALISTQASANGFHFLYARDLFGAIDHIEANAYFEDNTASCLVDTGARFTLAKESLLRNNTKVGEVRGGGVSGKENVTELVLSKTLVGEWQSSQPFVGRKPDHLIPADCLIGNDFFLHREFSIDFLAMRFSSETSFNGDLFQLNRYPSDFGGHFGFTFEIGGETVETLFDTGATNTVFDSRFVEENPDNFVFLRELDVTEGSNQSIKAGVYRAKSLRFGNLEDRDVEVYAVNLDFLQSKIPGIRGIVGLNQMIRRKWYFNNNRSTWGVTQKVDKPPTP